MSSSFSYSTSISPSRSPLQRKFDSEKKHKERIAQINEKNKECQIRRKWLDDTFKEAMKQEQKQSFHEQNKNENKQDQNENEQIQDENEQNEQENDNSLLHSNESNIPQENSLKSSSENS